MHRVDGPANQSGHFTEGNPGQGVPATVVTGAWAEAVQEELCNLVEGAGITLSKPANNQVLAAIKALIDIAVPAGTIFDWPGSSAPSGFVLAQGQAVSRTGTYSRLFAAYGTTYGSGDGSTTFNLPDLRGRVSIGVGQGSGLTNRVLAATGGEETHQLTEAEIPSHNHGFYNSISGAGNDITNGGNHSGPIAAADSGITDTGGDAAHNNMQPFIVLNKIIRL